MQQLATKTEFARETGVSEAAVRKWISTGIITGDALHGEGRKTRIYVELAKRQVADRRDPGQAMGNGLDTRLSFTPSAVPRAEPQVDLIADQLKTERLRSIQFANARTAEEALARRGIYIRADQTQAAMTRVAAKMLQVFEGALADIAGAIAAKHGLDRREVLHEARGQLRTVRAKAAEAARREAESHTPLIEDLVADASDPAAGEA